MKVDAHTWQYCIGCDRETPHTLIEVRVSGRGRSGCFSSRRKRQVYECDLCGSEDV